MEKMFTLNELEDVGVAYANMLPAPPVYGTPHEKNNTNGVSFISIAQH